MSNKQEYKFTVVFSDTHLGKAVHIGTDLSLGNDLDRTTVISNENDGNAFYYQYHAVSAVYKQKVNAE